MDDSCAVCADHLDWVAYGPCGHREVCSTCVVRLRFLLGDRRCCICKSDCPTIFVTKALGDYTRVLADFSVFLTGRTEGKAGEYWYNEDTQAYFDDDDHYKTIKAMCHLSCGICDKNPESQCGKGTKRGTRFWSIEQLNGHLRHQHNLFMCNLCLEGRKVFVCEQKLYTRSQLDQHKSTGDSEVDGDESERGGFTGHPMCKFCRSRFYGDNELYTHMSTEHYTCHLCQRHRPGRYDYFSDYNDLEMHFRREHFLCENDTCLEMKFIVFQTEAEMKRHNALEHGGHLSRSKRNAALMIPASFRHRQNEQAQHRGRGHGFHHDPSNNQLSLATQASLETASATDCRFQNSSFGAHLDSDHRRVRHVNAITGSSEVSTANQCPETSLNQNSRTTTILEESSFPPLSNRELPKPSSSRYVQALSQSSSNPVKLREESFPPLPGATNKPKPTHRSESSSANTLAARLQRNRRAIVIDSAPPRPLNYHDIFPSASQLRTTPNHGITPSACTSSQPRANWTRKSGFKPSSSASYSVNSDAANRMKHLVSAPNLAEEEFFKGEESFSQSNQSHASNKSLVEKIQASLGMDEEKYDAFRSISLEYRQGAIDISEYLFYVEQFGLSHLVLELAHLCPDARKKKELIDAYNASFQNKSLRKNAGTDDGRKGKGRISARADTLTDNFLDTVKKLQLNQKSEEEEVEKLHKDGYRVSDHKPQSSNKQSKKKSKFHRVLPTEDSAIALDLFRRDANTEAHEKGTIDGSSETIPVIGVWRRGGAQRLFANSSRNA